MSLVKFKISITMLDDNSVRVESINPGAASPWEMIGLIEKVKTEIIMSMTDREEIDDS